jgi:uncharacterized protein (TIGR00290 family)
MAHKSYFNWSGGKDSALALYYAKQNATYSIEKLLTTVNQQYKRISMHGVQEVLLEQQAAAIGLPLQKLQLPVQPSMQEYEQQMMETIKGLQYQQFTHSFFGDIFLEDLKRYREQQLAKVGFEAVFPLWKRNTLELMHEFLALGFKTIVVCINAQLLDKSFAGRIIDEQFLNDLPGGVDPCGENGEFHTFVFDGPLFHQPVAFEIGETVYREYKAPQNNKDNCFTATSPASMGFWFCDLLPKKERVTLL